MFSWACSSQASGSPFWISWRSRSRGYKQTSSPPLCRSCGLIPDMHLTNYYETEWISLLDVRNWWKLQHAAILSGLRHFCMLRLSKNSYLDDSSHKLLMIPHTNFEMFDDSTHEYCIHPRRLSVLTEYLSLSLTHFTPINLTNHYI